VEQKAGLGSALFFEFCGLSLLFIVLFVVCFVVVVIVVFPILQVGIPFPNIKNKQVCVHTSVMNVVGSVRMCLNPFILALDVDNAHCKTGESEAKTLRPE